MITTKIIIEIKDVNQLDDVVKNSIIKHLTDCLINIGFYPSFKISFKENKNGI
jgi:hypothetical protein